MSTAKRCGRWQGWSGEFAQYVARPRNGTGLQTSARPARGGVADSTDVRQDAPNAASGILKEPLRIDVPAARVQRQAANASQ